MRAGAGYEAILVGPVTWSHAAGQLGARFYSSSLSLRCQLLGSMNSRDQP